MNGMTIAFTCICMLSLAAKAEEVTLTWSGGADEPKWSIPANWNEGVAPVAGDGNEYRLSFSGSVDVFNDVPGVLLRSLQFSGSGAASLSGEEFCLVGGAALADRKTSVFDSTVLLTVNAPVRFTGYGTVTFNEAPVVFNGAFTSDGQVGMMTLYHANNAKAGSFVTFNAPVTMPQISVRVATGGQNGCAGYSPCTFNAPISVSNFTSGLDYRAQYVDLAATGNVFRLATTQFASIRAQRANAFPEELVMDWGNATVAGANDNVTAMSADGANGEGNEYNLNGYDQEIDRVSSCRMPLKGSGAFVEAYQISSSRPATLTMKASDNGLSYARVNGKVSVVWDPKAAYTLTWSNRTNLTDGVFEVLGGTLALVNGVKFPNLSRMVVQSGASMTVDAASGPTLFGETPVVQLVVSADDSNVTVPAGVTLKVASLVVKGVRLSDCTVNTGDAGASWLTGGGSVQVAAFAADGVTWKDAVDGNWSDGAKWQGDAAPAAGEKAVLDVKGASYAVAVDAGVDDVLANDIELGGFSADGKTATLAVARDVKYVGENATVGDGGVWSVTDGTLTVREKDALQNVIRLTDGGVFRVDGGEADLLGNRSQDGTFNIGFNGSFTVENGGRLEVKSGLFSFSSYYPLKNGKSQVANKGRVENPLTILPGGVLAVSGGRAKMRTQDYWGPGLWTDGGAVEVSGDGVLDLAAGTGAGSGDAVWFGHGEVSFRDNARLEFTGSYANSQRFSIPYEDSDKVAGTCAITFEGSSVLCCTNDFYLQRGWVIKDSNPVWNTSSLTLASTAEHFMGGVRAVVGSNAGKGVLNLSDGTLNVAAGASDGYGLYVGDYAEYNIVLPNGANVRPEGVVNVSGGALKVNGRRGASQTRIAGLTLGNGAFMPKKPSSGWTTAYAVGPQTCYSGALNVSGSGVVTNMGGAFAVGVGLGRGVVSQTGGEIVADSSTAEHVIGLFGGKGVWTLAGGKAELAGNLWVGGVAKTATTYYSNVTTLGYMKNADGSYAEFDCADRHDARGELRVSNGTFAVSGSLVLSADGVGSLTIGEGGLVTAGSLTIPNASAAVTIKLGADGSGCLAINGDVDVAAGAKLVIDATAVDTETFKKSNVLSYKTATNMFTDTDIAFIGKDRLALRKTATGLSVANPRGLMILFR